MSVPFSEDLWQRLSALWRRDKKEVEEAVGYDDPQLKQMLDVMMVSRRSMKAAEKQKYDIDRAWRRVEKQTAGGWRVPGWCRYAAAVTVLFFSVWGWVTYNRESALPVTGELTDVIQPGVSKAELILASGERIILGTQTEIRDIEELGVKITNDTIPAFVSGSMILPKIWKRLQPSSNAASSSSFGNDIKNCLRRNVPNALNKFGRNNAGIVSRSPRL